MSATAMRRTPHGSAFASLCLIAFLAIGLFANAGSARAGMEPGPGNAWLTIASRTDPNDAIALAQRYAGQFPTAVVFEGSNGYFAVALGWIDKYSGEPLLADLKARGAVPSDSYFTLGARFVRAIWTAGGSQIYDFRQLMAATQIGRVARSANAPQTAPSQSPARIGIVGGLKSSGDDYLSLRSGPGSGYQELARMRADTRLAITGSRGAWLQVSLANGMQGWAFGKYVQAADVPMVGPSQTANAPAAGQQQRDVPVIGPEPAPQPPQQAAPRPAPQPQEQVAKLPEVQSPAVVTSQPVAPLADQKRVALVMGNSKYRNTTELANPKNDAAAMSERLESLGFTVITGLDGTKTDMELAVREFVKILPDSDVALFFYAGHAMQVNGKNYIIPVDAKLEDSTALDFETIDLGVVLNFMSGENRISIALLDACRDNPMSRTFARNFKASRSAFIGRGLAAPATEGGEMLIGFATAPGEVALDGEGANSPFTTALLKHISEKNLDVELMLKKVKRDVYEATGRAQEPWHNSALRQEFYFNPGK